VTLKEFLDRLDGVRPSGNGGYIARCPAHNDQRQSLSVRGTADGTILARCHAGCEFEEICRALDVPMSALFAEDGSGRRPREARRITATYDYVDEVGTVVFQAVRYEPKGFAQRRVIPREHWRTPDEPEHAWALASGWYGRDAVGQWRCIGSDRAHPPTPEAFWLDSVPPLLYRLEELAALRPPRVFVVEGEKDADALWSLGIPATTNAMGAGKWRPEHSRALARIGVRDVVALPDNDGPGRAHAEAVARHNDVERLPNGDRKLSTRVVALSGLPEHGDVSDWLSGGGTRDALLVLAEAASVWEPTDPEADADLPTIDLNAGELREVADTTWDAVRAANTRLPRLFRRLGTLARLVEADDGAPVIQTVTDERLRWFLARWARWTATGKRGPQRATGPSATLSADLLAHPDPPVPVLREVVEVPVFAGDGRLITRPGFDDAEGLYLWPAPGLHIPPVPERPTAAELARAAATILELIQDFPFKEDADRAHAVALLLLPFCRRLIPGATPLHLVLKPTPGTGASLLVKAVLYPALGRAVAPMTECRDPDEWRKRLASYVLEGARVIYVDNLNDRLAASALMSALTEAEIAERRLGSNDIIRGPLRPVWVASGNNVKLSGEGARRAVGIRLDAQMEHPWLRHEFAHPDLMSWATTQRGELVAAALTLGQGWLVADRLVWTDRRLGSFERWGETMGGILTVAGVPGFLENVGELYAAADDEDQDARAFVALWWERHQDAPVTTRRLLLEIVEHEACPLVVDGHTDHARKVRLGKELARLEGRVWTVEGGETVRLVRQPGRATWRLVRHEPF
jgi:hypothetical protein